MPENFQHKPLDQPDKQVRLFFLTEYREPTSCDLSSSALPNATPQQRCISGHLEQFRLEKLPEYVALSYFWGDTKNPGQIVVDGAPFDVTVNLLAALEVLATLKELGGRPLWIDAICINQQNKDEKELQVPLMGRIYSQASEVFAWIGREEDESANVLDILVETGNFWLEDDTREKSNPIAFYMPNNKMDDGPLFKFLYQLVDPDFQRTSTRAGKFFDRPWWSRVWVIQEVTLAKNASILCGSRLYPWRSVIRAFQFSRTFQHDIWGNGPSSFMQVIYRPVEHFQVFKKSLEQGDSQGSGISLEEALKCLIRLNKDTIQASDRRDHIYGLRALLSPRGQAVIHVDYSENNRLSDIMNQITFYMFQQHGPRILAYCHSASTESHTLPSWYIDWLKIETSLAMYDPIYRADFSAAGFKPWLSGSFKVNEKLHMPLEGAEISRVGRVANFDINPSPKEAPDQPEAEKVKEIVSWLGMMHELLKELPGDSSGSTGRHSSKDNIWLVPIAGVQHSRFLVRSKSNKRVVQNESRPFEAMMSRYTFEAEEIKQQDDRYPNVEESFQILVGERQPGRRFHYDTWNYWRRLRLRGNKGFVTPEGRAGLGPRSMQSDDLVVIFKGCEYPFVIRPRCEEKKEYELVGACYVDGIMMGEAMKENPVFEQMFLV